MRGWGQGQGRGLRRAKRRWRGERGQVLVLLVGFVAIVALGMMTSYGLSQAVHERIKLQNAADATAYSLAILEARALNFMAFANRAQVAHYAQMLEAQSILSSATYAEGVTGLSGDVLQSAARTLELVALSPELLALAQALSASGLAFERAHGVMKPVVDQMDRFTPKYIELQTIRNQALFGAAALMMLTTVTQLAEGGQAVTTLNDPEAQRDGLSYALNGLNVASFLAAFDWSALALSGEGAEARAAKRIMTEMVHASRYGSSRAFGAQFVVSRLPFQVVGDALSHMLPGIAAADAAGDLPLGMGRVLQELAAPFFVGTSKLLSAGTGGGLPALSDTGQDAPERSDLATGEALVARDQSKGFVGWRDFASVRSMSQQGQHCRYEKPEGSYGVIGRWALAPFGVDFHCDREEPSRHRWGGGLGAGGIQPFFKFAPRLQGLGAEHTSFNQPDVWVALSKPMGSAAYEGEGRTMRALARAQVYYHRPGAWQEPPNLFAPFWGAHLAPKNAAIKRLTRLAGLEGAWGEVLGGLVGDHVWMH